MNEQSLQKRLQEIVDLVRSDLSSLRTGRANPGLVSDIICPAYGGQSQLKVQELATISTQDAQTIVISPFDKSIIGDIKKGIDAANVGLNPNIDGEIIRISLPPMTGEDREKYIKLLGQKVESGKIMIRQARGDEMKDIKNAFESKDISEDEKAHQEKRLQEIVDEYVEKIEKAADAKKQELLQV